MLTHFLQIAVCISLLVTTTAVNANDLVKSASTAGDGKPDPKSLAKGQIEGKSYASESAGVVANQAWGVLRDKGAEIVFDEAKMLLAGITTDSVDRRLIRGAYGHIYKITPKGKKLPLGFSPETIQDLAIDRGYTLERVKLTTKQAEQLGKRLEGAWAIYKFGDELWKIHSDETLTPEEQRNRIITETIAAEVGLAVGSAISKITTAAQVGTAGTLGIGLAAGVALDRVKTAFITYQEMAKAMEQAVKDEENAVQELVRMGHTKITEIRKAIDEGHLDKASEMCLDMSNWASKRAWGSDGIKEMWDLYDMCSGMLRDIETTRKQMKQEQIDAYNHRLAEYARKHEEARKREEELAKLFSIQATATKYILAPEETTTITIAALTGTPPFTLSGVLSATFDAENPFVLELPIGQETGIYGLPITATDAAGHVREAELTFKVINDGETTGPGSDAQAASVVLEKRGYVTAKEYDLPLDSYTCIEYKIFPRSAMNDPKLVDKFNEEKKILREKYYREFIKFQGKQREPDVFLWGLPHGPYTKYTTYGALDRVTKEMGTHKNGVLHGETTFYNLDWKNGDKLTRIETISYEDGKKTGVTSKWYPSGQMEYKKSYKDDVPHGEWILWHPDGTLKRVQNYHEGKFHGLQQHYRENGSLSLESDYKQGSIHGWQREYREDETLQKEITYENGSQTGPYRSYWKDGKTLLEKGQVLKGNFTGVWTSFREDGSIKSTFDHDTKKSRYYREDGSIR